MAIQNYLDASTAHITDRDVILLKCEHYKFPSRIIAHEYGWWISVPDKESIQESTRQMLKDGCSSSFVELFIIASNSDCWWINLDMDAPYLTERYHETRSDFEAWKLKRKTPKGANQTLPLQLNRMRALQAEKALLGYDPGIMELGGIDEEFVIDLMADLLHFCAFKGWSHSETIETAGMHFLADQDNNVSREDR